MSQTDKERSRAYYLANREKIKARSAAYFLAHREEALAKSAARWKANVKGAPRRKRNRYWLGTLPDKYGKSKEYRTWQYMKKRCYNPNCPKFPIYGGRGILICAEWLDSYEKFLEDMGPAPSAAHSIDRKKNNEGYSKENCWWALPAAQGRNRGYAKLTLDKAEEIRILYSSGGFTQQELADEYGVNQTIISDVILNRLWKFDAPLS